MFYPVKVRKVTEGVYYLSDKDASSPEDASNTLREMYEVGRFYPSYNLPAGISFEPMEATKTEPCGVAVTPMKRLFKQRKNKKKREWRSRR